VLLLSWLPVIGDPLCALAGWLKLALPQFHVHQIVDNHLMNEERYGQEGAGPEPAVHG
jgi:hypothetical protein